MQRRTFLKNLLTAGAAAAAAPLIGETFIPFAEAAGIPKFSFAHITDLHLDVKGTSTWQYREKSVPLFIDTLRQIGRLQKLSFVLFGGDQVHAGPNDRESLFVFQEWAKQLDVTHYILLGNMEVSPIPGKSKFGRSEYLFALRGRGLEPGQASWTADPVKGVRVIGFDVTVDGKPYGEASPLGLKWLAETLDDAKDKKLVIVATHQLLLPTCPRDSTPEWSLFMVKNHAVVRELLEQYPNVRLVLSGHHHVSKVETVKQITYVSDPAIVTYPCAFRLFEVASEGIHLKNIGLGDRSLVNRARDLLVADPYAKLYDPSNPQNVLAYSVGLTEQDREATIAL
ncbi:MAG: metallophosphoesterase [Nitrospiraceae bacterium]|nr:metallophosphoesterase [Nitrospiraceae bacterium]